MTHRMNKLQENLVACCSFADPAQWCSGKNTVKRQYLELNHKGDFLLSHLG